ncbi:hypothetical protein R3P38DRAFT_3239490 [Favolaschia claudopus]|uniref:Uncharacterized protein n=1 Tax=Favolaschia claudopus TaxID=2862362 RepID=A0AAV9Z8M8_9AGAR
MSSYDHLRFASNDSSSSGSTFSMPGFQYTDSDSTLPWGERTSQHDTPFADLLNPAHNQLSFQDSSVPLPPQASNPAASVGLMHRIQLQNQEISMLKTENAFLKYVLLSFDSNVVKRLASGRNQNSSFLQMISTFSQKAPSAAPVSNSPDESLRHLTQVQYPLVKFWQRGTWSDLLKSDGVTGSTKTAPDGRKYTPASFLFAEDAKGQLPTEDEVVGLKTAAANIFTDLARQQLLPDASLGWGHAGHHAKTLFYASLETKFPSLRLCSNNWKADWVATHSYSNWKGSHGNKYLKRSIKTEPDELDVTSPSPPRARRKQQASKRKQNISENTTPETAGKRVKTHNSEGLEESDLVDDHAPLVPKPSAKKVAVTLGNPLRTTAGKPKMVSRPSKPLPSSAPSASASTPASSLIAPSVPHPAAALTSTSTSAPASTLPPNIPAAPLPPPPAAAAPPPTMPRLTILLPKSTLGTAAPSTPASPFDTPPSHNPLDALALVAANASAGEGQKIRRLLQKKNKKGSNGPTARALCQTQWLLDNPGETKKTFVTYWSALGQEEKQKWKIREAKGREAYAQALAPSRSTA